MYPKGALSKFHTDNYDGVTYDLDPAMVPIDNSTMPAEFYLSPKNRFRGFHSQTETCMFIHTYIHSSTLKIARVQFKVCVQYMHIT